MRTISCYILSVLISSLTWATLAVYCQSDRVASALVGLQSPDRDVRYSAVNSICKEKDDARTVEPLLTAIDDSDHDVRGLSIRCLGFRKEKRAIQPLLSILAGPNGDRVEWAVAALGQIGDPAAIEPLIFAMNTRDENRWWYVNALANFDDLRVSKALFDMDKATEFGETLAKGIGSAGVEYVADKLANGTPAERDKAVWALTYIADERALNSLLAALAEPDGRYVWSVQSTLCHRIGTPAIPRLVETFGSANAETRKRIARVLGHIEGEQGISALIYLIRNNKPAIRVEILESLVEGGGTVGLAVPWGSEGFFSLYRPQNIHPDDWKGEILGVFIAAAKDEDPSVRNLAIRSLWMINRAAVRQLLLDALSDPATGTESAIALGLLVDPRGLPQVLEALKSTDLALAARAQISLHRIGTPAVEGLIQILQDTSNELRSRELASRREEKRMREKYPFQFRCGNEPPRPALDPRVRAAGALGAIGGQRARVALTKALNDKDDWIRTAAAEAISTLDINEKASLSNK
jgi:HEAT repeat protein